MRRMASGPNNFTTGFQLSLELTKLIPVQEIAASSYASALQILRNWRNSGSDILGEQDLASAFGRVDISIDLESSFKQVVHSKLPEALKSQGGSKSQEPISVKPLYKGSILGLDHQGSETIRRINSREGKAYLSTVIQLSLLGWMHDRVYLATAIEQALQKRIENGIDGAVNPGFDGIYKTLEACSTQTASFPWDAYIGEVEMEIRKHVPSFRYQRQFTIVTENTIFAGIDCFCRLQRWPEEYKMVVNGLQGFITIIIWAHFVLGLTVEIVGSPGGNFRFGPQHIVHVFISWSDQLDVLEIHLLDSKDDRIFMTSLADDSSGDDLLSAFGERAKLKSYCMTSIRRELNAKTRVPEGDEVQLGVVRMVLAIAYIVSKKICRVRQVQTSSRSNSRPEKDNEWSVTIEEDRFFNSAETLFSGLGIDEDTTKNLANRIKGKPFGLDLLPIALQGHVERIGNDPSNMRELERFLQSLVSFVLLFALVDEVKTCADVPLILMESRGFVRLTIDKMLATEEKVHIEESTLFHALCSLLVGGSFGREDRDSGGRTFAVCDFGWSVHLDTVGDKDPDTVRPELLHLKEGVWVIQKSWRRKLRIRDANHAWHWDPSQVSPRVVIDKGDTYHPRCVTTVLDRKEYCCDRDKELLVGIKFDVDESDIAQQTNSAKQFELHSGFRFMHHTLWEGVRLTKACPHDEEETGERGLPVDVVTVGGLGEGADFGPPVPERICIALVHGDRRSRLLSTLPGGDRWIMLRRQYHTCVDCAVKEAASLNGKWLVVL